MLMYHVHSNNLIGMVLQSSMHMWQSWIERQYYYVAYFECVTEFDVSAKLLLGVHASYMYQVLVRLYSTYEPCVLYKPCV